MNSLVFLIGVVVANAVPDVAPREDRPVRVPSRPLSSDEALRRESLARFGVGLLRQRDELPVDAVQNLEAAAKLAPESAEPLKPLVNLYVELGRDPAAIRTARRILELDPQDADTAHRLGQLLFDGKKFRDAVVVLKQAAASPRIAERPARRFGILRDLARAAEAAADWAAAETALREALALAATDRTRLLRADAFDSPADLDRQTIRVHESLGSALAEQRKYAAATEAYAEAAKQAADDPTASARLAGHLSRILELRGEFAAAAQAAEKYLVLGPIAPEPYQRYADLLRRAGREGAVVPSLTRLAQAMPQVEAIRWVLAAEAGARSPLAAIQTFQTLASTTTDPAFFRVAVHFYRVANQPDQLLELADTIFRQARGPDSAKPGAKKAPPNREAVLRARGLVAAMKAEPGLTAQLLREIADPTGGSNHAADTWEIIGWLARRDGQLIVAERAFRQAVRSDNDRGAAEQLLELFTVQRKWAELRAECAELIQSSPPGRPLLYDVYLARSLAELGRGDEALRAVSRLPSQVNADGQVWARLQTVRILNLLGRHTEAIRECESILTDFPNPIDSLAVRYQLSEAYLGRREFTKAEAELRVVLDRDPDDMLALNNLAYNLAEQGRKLDEAERLIRRAIELDRDERLRLGNPEPESGVYLDTLGWVLFRQGKLAEAVEVLETAVTRPDSGSDAVVWDHLGDVAFRRKDTARARVAWTRAESLCENSVQAREGDRLKEIRRKLRLTE